MAIPTNKSELLFAINDSYTKLHKDIVDRMQANHFIFKYGIQ